MNESHPFCLCHHRPLTFDPQTGTQTPSKHNLSPAATITTTIENALDDPFLAHSTSTHELEFLTQSKQIVYNGPRSPFASSKTPKLH